MLQLVKLAQQILMVVAVINLNSPQEERALISSGRACLSAVTERDA
jgi:hypothetical protein